jgi:glycosyltransferase involved in cell wall biosynthesis
VKVALIHIRYVHKGGLETRLSNYLEYFSSKGDEVTLFTSKVAPDIQIPTGVNIVKIDISEVPKFIRPLWFNFRLCPKVRKEDFDFVLSLERTYCQDHVLAPSTHAGFVKRLRKNFLLPGDYLQLYLDRRSFKSSRRIYACSSMVKQEMIHYYKIDGSKIRVLSPPLHTKRFFTMNREEIGNLRKSFGIPEDAFVCLFVSTGHRRKGLKLVMELAKELGAPFYFLVAGTPFVSREPNLVSLGFVKDMNPIYNLADLVIHPAFYEPFGQIVSESLATQTPVLLSEFTGGKEILSKEVGKVIGDFSIKSWSSAIQSAKENPLSVPVDYVKKLNLDLNAHMSRMLEEAISS